MPRGSTRASSSTDVLEHILGLGPRLVAITMGTRGAVAASPKDRRASRPSRSPSWTPSAPATASVPRCSRLSSSATRSSRTHAAARRLVARGSGRIRGHGLRDHLHAKGSRPTFACGDRCLDRIVPGSVTPCPTTPSAVAASACLARTRAPSRRTSRRIQLCPVGGHRQASASAVADGGELLGQAAAEGRHECEEA